jgi:hypothetical protein
MFIENIYASHCFTTSTIPSTTSEVYTSLNIFSSTPFLTSSFLDSTQNTVKHNYTKIVISTTTLEPSSLNTCIYKNTMGIYSSSQNHPSTIPSKRNSVEECGDKCFNMYPGCTVFIYSIQNGYCYTFDKIKWKSLTFRNDTRYSMGRLTASKCDQNKETTSSFTTPLILTSEKETTDFRISTGILTTSEKETTNFKITTGFGTEMILTATSKLENVLFGQINELITSTPYYSTNNLIQESNTPTNIPATERIPTTCSILDFTIGISSKQNIHPSGVFQMESQTDCCQKCLSHQPPCTTFVYSYRLQQCFTYKFVRWSNLKLLNNSYYSIGRTY